MRVTVRIRNPNYLAKDFIKDVNFDIYLQQIIICRSATYMLYPPWSKVEHERLVRFVDGHCDIVQVSASPCDPELGEESDGEHHKGGLSNCLSNTDPELRIKLYSFS